MTQDGRNFVENVLLKQFEYVTHNQIELGGDILSDFARLVQEEAKSYCKHPLSSNRIPCEHCHDSAFNNLCQRFGLEGKP